MFHAVRVQRACRQFGINVIIVGTELQSQESVNGGSANVPGCSSGIAGTAT